MRDIVRCKSGEADIDDGNQNGISNGTMAFSPLNHPPHNQSIWQIQRDVAERRHIEAITDSKSRTPIPNNRNYQG
ncbi:hypothetical protein M514_06061 [Trichuris suis]|uniref:Uncharacterized protein n=1 Tax=Trichuris suis TaxID=68888 RepID=A0A085NMK8_9BILA|nr:hypothetical protein M513_06061 [Trichuris suis]KFD70704.1 hypothetical protein M514_06061 [Trichuris suis]